MMTLHSTGHILFFRWSGHATPATFFAPTTLTLLLVAPLPSSLTDVETNRFSHSTLAHVVSWAMWALFCVADSVCVVY